MLGMHPSRCFVSCLLDGLVHGFLAGLCCVPVVSHDCHNLQTVLKEPAVVDALFKKEVAKGFMIGPFVVSPFSLYRVSPIGVATRKYLGKKRLIIDLSAPHNGVVPSIKSLIPREQFSPYYASVDNAIRMRTTAGSGSWLGKADITDAFKVMPLHPSQWHLFGVRWGGKLYFTVSSASGCCSSLRLLDMLSEALCWILVNVHRLPFVLHLLDDFLVVDFPLSPPACCISVLRDTFGHLGVLLSTEKTVGPFTSFEFLGINLYRVAMQASLPSDKLEHICGVLRAFYESFSQTANVDKRA